AGSCVVPSDAARAPRRLIRHLAHPDLANGVHHVLALRDQNIDLPQLRDDLFRLVSLPCHSSPPGCQRHTSSRTTSMGVDQGGGLASAGHDRGVKTDPSESIPAFVTLIYIMKL